jgi:hypothetical protein
VFCPMVLHRKPSEFARDLTRVRAEFAGERRYCESLWDLPGEPGHAPVDPHFVRQFADHSMLADFRKALTREVAGRANALKDDEAKDALRMAVEESSGDLVMHELTDGSVAVMTRPIDKTDPRGGKLRVGSIWRAYRALADIS